MENCAICGQPCTPALYRVKPDGVAEPLCSKCSGDWLESDGEWPENTQKEDKQPIPAK